jgi:diguanylate cyclase (GGDEF)-like protein
MPAIVKQIISDFWYPIALPLIGVMFLDQLQGLGWAWSLAPYWICGIGIIFATRFHRSRIAFALILILIAYLSANFLFTNGAPDEGVTGQVIYPALAFLLPINFVVLAFLKERGVLTLWGGYRLSLIGNQIVFVALFASGLLGLLSVENEAALNAFWADLLHARMFAPEFDHWTYLPQPALLSTAICAVALLARYALWGTPVESGFLAAMLATMLGLHYVAEAQDAAVLFSVAGLILGATIIHDVYRMAFLDELTGLPARRALLSMLSSLSGRYTISMLDIDHFKKFNDTHGHDVGDQVLRMVANCLADVKGGGRAFRYGGEEFTIVFSSKSAADAMPYLEAVREAVAASEFVLRGDNRPKRKPKDEKKAKTQSSRNVVHVTISIGVAEKGPDHGGPDEVMKSADTALYRAKDAGRNNVSL